MHWSVLSNRINGISLGSVYAIIALGYTMVYGIAKMLNFAHGDVIMIGAYISFCVTQYLKLPAWLSVLAAMFVCTLLGMTIERLAYKPLRSAPSLAVLITAIGMSYLLQNLALLIWGSNPKSFTSIISFGPVRLFDGQLIISDVAIVTNVNRTISVTFAIGSALAAIAGVLLCSAYPTLMPTTGSMPGIKAFTAAVFGGIGSIPGAMLGGILLGIIEIFGKSYISTELGDAIVFAILIVILLVKPAGLLGKKIREKV